MRAVVYDKKNKRLKLIETDMPVPKPGEVLVRVFSVGICGSDTEMVNADTVADGFIMGHEVAGIVETIGEGVTSVSVGDRVTPRPVGCGECPVCLMGNTHLCLKKTSIGTGYLPGGFADFVCIPEPMLYAVPEGMTLRIASLTDTFAVPAHAIAASGLKSGQSALIVGAGPIGLSALLLASDVNPSPLGVADLSHKRLNTALSLGAGIVFSPTDDGYYQNVRDAFGGLGPDVAIECTGNPHAMTDAVELVRPGGRVTLTGICFEPMTLHPLSMIMREVSILPAFSSLPADNRLALSYLARKPESAGAIISDIVALDEMPEIFEAARRGEVDGKVVVEPHTE
ncbi:MAG: alcohol dehydrogenase catalytic domain-containing protein [Deltaproteobacteria bacterium]|nr:alcohol dehydrogenase catalytic domain-containing protein [Candidatus Zymogenaceae bacterium]